MSKVFIRLFETFFRVFLWCFIISLLFGYFLFLVKESFPNDFFTTPLNLLVFLIGLVLFFLWIKPIDKLRRELFRKQFSWVFYVYVGLVSSPMVSEWFYIGRDLTFCDAVSKLVFNFMIILLGFVFYLRGIPRLDVNVLEMRFAAGSMSIGDDELGFSPSAKQLANGLQNLSSYVTVAGLYGGLGRGKSSYTRMILESMNREETLYTYISLTETNEAKDFSLLFGERWMKTLIERYPKVDAKLYLPAMNSILRESGYGWMSGIFGFIENFNVEIIKTLRKASDEKEFKKENVYVSKAVAKLFGNVPEIKEKIWVLVFDEIERAQLDEIYRMVEIIERFKNEGRNGLPVKLIFLLCVSRSDLKRYLDTFKKSDPKHIYLKIFSLTILKVLRCLCFCLLFTLLKRKNLFMERLMKS
ncbi:MAG: P-loop NTPase fold protein [Candidatus Gracilibacteria bacterium]